MTPEEIVERVKCCTCGGSLQGSCLNLVGTDRAAAWRFPVIGNVLTGERARAASIVCDACLTKPLLNAVEFRGDEQAVVYHALATLPLAGTAAERGELYGHTHTPVSVEELAKL